MFLKAIKNRKISRLVILAVSSLISNSSFAVPELWHQGESIPERLSFELDFQGADYIKIMVPQKSADFKISIERSGSHVKTVNFSSHLGQDEIILIESTECTNCKIVVEGHSEVDKVSPYFVYGERIYRVEIQSQESISRIEALVHITNAGEYKNLALTDGSDVESHLRNAFEYLQSAALKLESSEQYDELWLHSKILGAQVLIERKRVTEAINWLRPITLESRFLDSTYSAQAYFELAAFEPNVDRKKEMFESGKEIAINLEDKVAQAQALNYLAMNNIRASRYNQGFEQLYQAKQLYVELNNWRGVLDVLHNLSWGYRTTGNYTKSLAYAMQQKLMAEKFSDEENSLWSLSNLARGYENLGDLYMADEFLDEALVRFDSISYHTQTPLLSLHAHLLTAKSERHLLFGHFDRAEKLAIEALREANQLGWPSRIADSNFLLGRIALARLDFDSSEKLYLTALDYDEKETKNQRSASNRLLSLTDLHIKKEEYVEASKYLVRALRMVAALKDKAQLSLALLLTGELLHKLGGNFEAKTILDSISFYQNGEEKASMAQIIKVRYLQALVSNSLGHSIDALEYLRQARNLIDEQLNKFQNVRLRQEYLALHKKIYEASISVLVEHNPANVPGHIELLERFKARTLIERILMLDSNSQLDRGKKHKRDELISQLKSKASDWYSGPDQTPTALLDKIKRLGNDIEKLEAEVLISKIKEIGNQTIFRADELRADPDELIAYYFLGEKESWVWSISQKVKYVSKLPPEPIIRNMVSDYLEILSTPPTARAGYTVVEQQQANGALAQVISLPLQQHLKNPDIRRITLIPDGTLVGVPFAPLRINSSSNPLIHNYTISYISSLKTRAALSQRSKLKRYKPDGEVLVVADPVNTSDIGVELGGLPESRSEAESVQSIVGSRSTLLIGEAANMRRLQDALNRNHSIIHIATHALVNNLEPSLSGLMLSGNNSKNSLWLAPEISNGGFNASLVVLSACDTAQGKQVEGEGLQSLSRAFIEGGANQVMGSLWKVQDRSTSAMMTKFYQAMSNSQSDVATALREAQISMYMDNENDWVDPYYWGGFQIFGG